MITNQQQVDGVSNKLLPLKTGPYFIVDKPTETTYILKDQNKEHVTKHRNHIVPYYPKEKFHLFTNEVPTLKQPNVTTKTKSDIQQPEKENTHQYNLRKKKITLL